MYNILNKVEVIIVTYLCELVNPNCDLKISNEHYELGLFTKDQIRSLNMPEGYKRSIWHKT